MTARTNAPQPWRGTQIPWVAVTVLVISAGITGAEWLHLSNPYRYPALVTGFMILGVLAAAVLVAITARGAARRAAITTELVEVLYNPLGWGGPSHGIVKPSNWQPIPPDARSPHMIYPSTIRLNFTAVASMKQLALTTRLAAKASKDTKGPAPDEDLTMGASPEWLSLIKTILAEQIGVTFQLKVDRRGRYLVATPAGPEPEEEAEDPRVERLRRVTTKLFGATSELSECDQNAKGRIQKFTVTHQISESLALNENLPRRIETTISKVLPGRWRGNFDLETDVATFEERPTLPKLLWPRIYPELTSLKEATAKYRNTLIYFAENEDRQPITWHPRKVPHRLIIGPTGSGKALDVATPIATPDGWTTMGELSMGTTIFDEAGNPCLVTGVFDQPLTDNCYEVTFSDGSTIVADGDHLWFTHDRNARISQSQQERRGPRQAARESWLSPTAVERLRSAAKAAKPGDGITIPEAAALASVDASTRAIHHIAKSLGPIRIIETLRSFNYQAQNVVQKQKVRVFDSALVCDYLTSRALRSRPGSSFRQHSPALTDACRTLRGRGQITAQDIATATGLPTKTVRSWLPRGLPSHIEVRDTTLSVPQRIVTRRADPVKVYDRFALCSALANHGERPMRDQRHLRTLGQVRTTDEIRNTLLAGNYVNHSVPLTRPLNLPDAELPIAPYTFGAWLGDGTSTTPYITSADPEIINRIRQDGYSVSLRRRAVDPTTKCRSYRIDDIRSQLQSLGVLHKGRGSSKHLPDIYLRSSERQRRELLAGLLDTDGTVSGTAIEYTTTSLSLAEGVTELALSLGYRAVARQGRAMLNGRYIGPKWRVTFTTTDQVFSLPRKNQTLATRSAKSNPERNRHRYITRIEKVSPRPTRCITVNSPNRLFLAGTSLIPTHNTSAIHTFITQTARNQWAVNIVDRKNIEYRGFRDWPNVQCVATRIEDQIALIHSTWVLMKQRYEASETGAARTEDFPPVLLVLDEYTELVKDIATWYAKLVSKTENTSKWPKFLPTEEEVGSILRLGRTARIHVLIGMQRPDAKYVEGENRDNLTGRQSLGRLGRHGAAMLWDDYYTGTTIPPGLLGRGMALNDLGKAVEVQNYFTPDPYKPDDLTDDKAIKTLEMLRPTVTSHPRIVFDTPYDPHGDEQFHIDAYLNAKTYYAVDRPDLDPLSDQYRFKPSADSSAAAAATKALGPSAADTVIIDLDAPTPAAPTRRTRDAGRSNDKWPGYGKPIPRPIDDLVVGDLICVDAGRNAWAILTDQPEADILDSEGSATLNVRNEDGDYDCLTVSLDAPVITRPLLDDDDESAAA